MPHTKNTRFNLAQFMKARKVAREKAVDENRKLSAEYKKVQRAQEKVTALIIFFSQLLERINFSLTSGSISIRHSQSISRASENSPSCIWILIFVSRAEILSRSDRLRADRKKDLLQGYSFVRTVSQNFPSPFRESLTYFSHIQEWLTSIAVLISL